MLQNTALQNTALQNVNSKERVELWDVIYSIFEIDISAYLQSHSAIESLEFLCKDTQAGHVLN